MKKTLIALAAVAATGAAFAQSSVTIYGKVDAGLARSMGSSVVELKQAAGSRLGFRGTEDLGGGLKANFQLEHRFAVDTGVDSTFTAGSTSAAGVVTPSSSTMWQGTSTVGLQGGFGKLDLGRTYAAAFWTALGGDVFGWDGVAANAAITNAGGNQTVRFGNVLSYTTPSMAGLTAQISLGLKESGPKNGTSFRLAYGNGPIAASLATEKGQAGQKYTGIGGSYDLGSAKLSALVSKGESAAGVKSSGMLFGAVMPMGAVTLKASYGTLKTGDNKVSQQLGLGMRYALSKRTDMYATLANDSKRAANKSGIEFGMQHNF